jgi:primase-polymerase (primpol)-like protein
MNFDNIPKELRELDRWVCWRWEKRLKKDGSPDDPAKMPINPITGGRAMSNNPATWVTYQDAVDAAQKGRVKDIDVCGIGFMFNGDGIIGVDIDHCRNPETGQLTDQAKDIIATLDSYTEYSQSGNGIHVICSGKLPEGGRRKDDLEMYSTGRYFIVTGYTLDDAHMSIEERTNELADVHERYINNKKAGKSVTKTDKNVSEVPVFVNDDELIDIAMNAKNGGLFEDLMNGNWKGRYKSQSEADIALCNLLAFYTGKDFGQMNRIFGRSGLMREKWSERHGEGGTYGEITIRKAISDCGDTYTPARPKKEKQVQDAPEIDTGLDALVDSCEKSKGKENVNVPGGVFVEDGVYKKIRYNKDSKEVMVLSNFILHPIKLIRFENCSILTVEIICITGKTYVRDIDIKHFTSLVPFKKALGELLVFNGRDTELEGIKALILKEEYPEIEGITHTGFLKKNGKWLFASSNMVVNESMKSVEGITVSVTEGKCNILETENISREELEDLADALFKFNKPGIAGVVIGWTASLFVREKLWDAGRIKHPHLLVIGEAGSGKSETIENITMPMICMDGQPAAAGQITRFSAMKNAASSNFVPYIIGEYKPSKLADWILREISEVLRNSYDRQEGQRGTTEQVLISYPYRAPILLIGEGSPTQETAIKERSVQLYMSKRDSKPYTEGYLKLKQFRPLIEKLGRLLLETSLRIDGSKFVAWHKSYYGKFKDVYDERIRQGIAVVCTGLSLVQRTFKDAGVSIALDEILTETVDQLKLDIYEGQDPKSDVIYTLELFDQLADIDILVDGVHYKKIQGTNELALCVSRIYLAAKAYCSKTKTELQQQKDFMSQIKRHDCFVIDKRTVRLYDLSKTYDKPVSCLVININNLKADISTLVGLREREEEPAIPQDGRDYNPFKNGEQQRLM